MRTLIKNGTIVNEGRSFLGDLVVDGEQIEEIYNKNLLNDKHHNITAPVPTFNELIEALRREYEKEEIEGIIKNLQWALNGCEEK